MTNREIQFGILPRDVLVAGERVAFDVAGETHVALDVADANDSDVTDVGGSERSGGKKCEETESESADGKGCETKRTGQHDGHPL
jgi:hypothetical protein